MAARVIRLVCALVASVGMVACSNHEEVQPPSEFVSRCVAEAAQQPGISTQELVDAAGYCVLLEEVGTPTTYDRTPECAAGRTTMVAAIETYYLNGGQPASATEAGLVTAGLLLGESSDFDISVDGQTVFAAQGGACA